MPSTDDDLESLVRRALEEPDTIGSEDLDRILNAREPGSQRNTVEALRSIAGADPERIEQMLGHLEADLTDDDERVRGDAAVVADELSMQYPERLAPLAPALVKCLDEEPGSVARNRSVQALARIGVEKPEVVVAAAPDLPPLLESDVLLDRLWGAEIAAAVATADPERAVPLVSSLTDVLSRRYERGGGIESAAESERIARRPADKVRQRRAKARWEHETARSRAARALGAVGRAHSDALREEVSKLETALEEENAPAVREELIGILASIAKDDPSVAGSVAASLRRVLRETGEEGTRARAAEALGELTEVDESVVEAVRPAAESLVEMLDADDPEVRGAAASLLMFVGDRYPGDVEFARPTLRSMLDDDSPFVRGCAAWILGSVGDAEDRERLLALGERDPDPDVRAATTRAAAEIEERLGG